MLVQSDRPQINTKYIEKNNFIFFQNVVVFSV